MTAINPARFPRLSEYVASLPQGLQSHPDALINAHVLDYMRVHQPDLINSGLPQPLVDALAGKIGDWFPEAHANALYMAMRDTSIDNDEALMRWSYESSTELFRKPLYRMLMMVLSPSLVVMGASKRWGTFHKGTDLSTSAISKEAGRLQLKGTLAYPTNLFNPLLAQFMSRAFVAAVSAARAADVRVQVPSTEAEQATFLISWSVD